MAKYERLQSKHKVLYVQWTKYVHTGYISITIGDAAFNEWVLAAHEEPGKGLTGVTIRDVYHYVMGNYATISQAEIDANLDTFNKPIDASRTIAIYIRKQ